MTPKTYERHSMRKTPEWIAWQHMKQRCDNPRDKSFDRYGGRGITVCDEWRRSFKAFYASIGARPSPRHSLDRINNARGYEPGNVRWATASEQARNRRSTRYITAFGETHLISEWAQITGIAKDTLHNRIFVGWNVEAALQTPPRNGNRWLQGQH